MSDVLNFALHLPRTKTKDMSAIKRIKGYCCEVTQEQWRELVKVADEVGCPVGIRSRRQGPDSNRGHAECFNNGVCEVLALKRGRNHESIPFDSFLAKLRDEVTEEVMRELGGGFAWQTVVEVRGQKWTGIYIGDSGRLARGDEDGVFELDAHVMRIPNMTASKLRILVAILKGEKI